MSSGSVLYQENNHVDINTCVASLILEKLLLCD